MIIARIIRKWFRQQDDFAALGEQLRRLHAGEIDRLEMPPGFRYQALLPECPKCGYRAEGGAAPTIESEIEEINESFDRIEQALDGLARLSPAAGRLMKAMEQASTEGGNHEDLDASGLPITTPAGKLLQLRPGQDVAVFGDVVFDSRRA